MFLQTSLLFLATAPAVLAVTEIHVFWIGRLPVKMLPPQLPRMDVLEGCHRLVMKSDKGHYQALVESAYMTERNRYICGCRMI